MTNKRYIKIISEAGIRSIFLALILFFTSFSEVVAVELNIPQVIRFRNYDNSSGLPGETVRTIYQDSKGLIWLGVEYQGLVGFDGNHFDLFSFSETDSTSLSSNIVECIIEDANGDLWIGTDHGLNKKSGAIHAYSSSQFEHFYQSEDEFSIPGNNVFCLFLNDANQLMVGTDHGLSVHLGNDQFQTISLNPKSEPQVLTIFQLNSGNLLIGTDQGLFMVNSTFSSVRHLLVTEFKEADINSVRTIYRDSENRFWLGTDRGLFVYQLENDRFYVINELLERQFRYVGIFNILEDNLGRVWVGSTSNGLYIFTKSGEKYTYISSENLAESGFRAYQIRTLFQDSQGIVWVGTKNTGIYLHDNRMLTFGYLGINSGSVRLSENDISAIYQDSQDNLYIGTRQGGLNIIDHATMEVTYLQNAGDDIGMNANRIEAITEDKDGKIWLGTSLGLSRYTAADQSFQHFYIDPVRSFLIDRRGQYWVGTKYGLYNLNLSTSNFDAFSPDRYGVTIKDSYTGLYESEDGDLWILTNNSGLLRYQVSTDSLIHYHRDHNNPNLRLPTNQIRSIKEDSYGHIWLGFRLNGLYRISSENGKPEMTSASLKNISIFSIEEGAPGELWLGSNQGIYKYETQTGQLENYSTKYGVQGEVFTNSAFFKSKDGTIYLGGNNGLNYFNPNKVAKQYFLPTISFKSITSLTSSVDEPAESGIYQFEYGSNVRFEFFLTDYSSPSKNKFEYKLNENDWISSGNQGQVAFANMEPGNYVITVRGLNSDQIYSENMAEINFKVMNPWWLTKLAKWIYFVLILIIVFVAYRMLVFRMRKHHELQVLQLEKQQADSLMQHKLQFFTNISHELRTPLTVMLPSAEALVTQEKGKNSSRHAHALLRNIKVLLSLIEELLEFRKIEQGHTKLNLQNTLIVSVCQAIYHEFAPLAHQKGLAYTYSFPEFEFTVSIDVKILDKVLRNLLSNAFKYTEEGNVALKVEVNQIEQELVLTVSDTGIGMPKEAIPHIFDRFYRSESQRKILKGAGIGLDLVQSLVNLHNGTVEVESKEGAGSKFWVTIPIEIIEKHELQLVDNNDEISDNLAEEVKSDTEVDTRIRILVVEDEPEIQSLLKNLFEDDFDVLVASNGVEGLDMAEMTPQPNIIISDIMMPLMNGTDLCQKIKSNYRTSHIPVILLTAKSATSDQILGLQVGADDYVTKPFYSNVLKAKVENILERQHRLKSYFEKEFQIKPNDPPVFNKEMELLSSCREVIQKNIDNPDFSVEDLAEKIGLSRAQLFRKLKFLVDQTPLELIHSIRMQHAVKLLVSNNYSASEVAYMTGFSSPSSFSTAFKKHYHITPKAYVLRYSQQQSNK